MSDVNRRGGMPSEAYKATAAEQAKNPSVTQLAGYQNADRSEAQTWSKPDPLQGLKNALGEDVVSGLDQSVAAQDMPMKSDLAPDGPRGGMPSSVLKTIAEGGEPAGVDAPVAANLAADPVISAETPVAPNLETTATQPKRGGVDVMGGLNNAIKWLAKTAPGVLRGALTMAADYNAGRAGYPELSSSAQNQARYLQEQELKNAQALKEKDVALAKYLQEQEPRISGLTAQEMLNPQLAYQRGMLNLQYGPDSPFVKWIMGQGGAGQSLAQQYINDPQAALAAYINGQVSLNPQQAWQQINSPQAAKNAALSVPQMKVK